MALRRPTLLVVDDDPGVLAVTLRACERLLPEFDVLTASDASTGLRILSDGRADVVVTDYRMPLMDGLTFLEEARLISRDFVPILCTAYLDDDLRRRCDALRLRVVPKPFHLGKLASAVRAAVERRTALRGDAVQNGGVEHPLAC